MKKTLFVMALAMVLVFAFSGVAMAKITNGYVTWDEANDDLDGTPATPHIGYTAATEKCAVCHSVHNAPVGGTSWTNAADPTENWTARSEDTQMLLRSNVANACIYCHITTNIGGTQLYNATEAIWTAPGSIVPTDTVGAFIENAAHNRNSANCVNCHAVHGANTFQGPAESKILKMPTTANIQDEILGASTDYTLDGGLYVDLAAAQADTTSLGKDYQVTVFCAQCHQNFSRASEAVLNLDGDNVYGDAGYVDGDTTNANRQYKSHPMKAAEASFVAAGDGTTAQAAWVASTTCRSCHDAGNTDEGVVVTDNNFPHYTAGAYNFVLVSENSGTAATASGLNHGSDGMCLKCHVNSDGTAGVGTTF
mgnify:FL=1